MFVRAKKSGAYQYLQVVHNERIGDRVCQRVIATLGRLDLLQKSGQIDAMISSCARFAQHVAVLDAHRRQETSPAETVIIGPSLVFEKLWHESGFHAIIRQMTKERKFGFAVERAIFLTVLHRLFDPGSDRAAETWRSRYAIEGISDLKLHHLYRAMAYLGEVLPGSQQEGATQFSPRTTKDVIEEQFFAHRRDLFTTLDLVFFDTTSIYFEGEGGESLGKYGNSKDHRPDRKQIVVGAVIDNEGYPVCCELWPGNTTDVKTLVPIVNRLKSRFGIQSVCVVADRGMISRKTVETLSGKEFGVRYILGVRMRKVKEVGQEVLSRGGRYHQVYGAKKRSKDPAPLKVKEVFVGEKRYIVCHNEDQARKDRQDREAIVASLRERLKQHGDKSLVGNNGYRKFLKTAGKRFEVNEAKVRMEERFDGKWVLETNMKMSAEEVALRYKELWMVESVFRSLKSVVRVRPVYHKCDETIRGHLFCSFLALCLLKQLEGKMEQRGWSVQWERLRHDLQALEEITVESRAESFVIRSRTCGDAGKALQAVGVALGPAVRLREDETGVN